MLHLKHPIIHDLLRQGYEMAVHAYLKPGGVPKFTVVAKHRGTGQLLQGWGGSGAEALADLARKSGRSGRNSRTAGGPESVRLN
jgi:hypothetical protein